MLRYPFHFVSLLHRASFLQNQTSPLVVNFQRRGSSLCLVTLLRSSSSEWLLIEQLRPAGRLSLAEDLLHVKLPLSNE